MNSRSRQSRHKRKPRIRSSYIWAGIMAVCALAALFAAIWVVITVYEKIAGDSSEWALEASTEESTEIEIETDEVYGWITDEEGTRYREADGSFAVNAWKVWEDRLYYLKEDGYMATEDVSIDGQIFFFGSDGALTDIQLDAGWMGLTGEDNPQNLDSLVKGHEFWCYLSSDISDTGIFKPIYYRKTTETEGRALGGESNPELSTKNSLQIHDGYLYYLPQVTSQTLSSLSQEEQELCNKLFRIRPGEAQKELLAESVTGYLVLEDGRVYYASEGKIREAGAGTVYSVGEGQYRVEVRDDSCYLIDSMGNMVNGDADGIQMIGSREYHLDHGRIVNVYPGEQRFENLVFTLENDPQNPGRKVIYKQEQGGQKTLAVRAPYGINSFCIAEGMLYYSAFTAQESDGTRYSELYRMNPNGIEAEQIGQRFQGNILNLYYYEEQRKIYGEYTPVSWKSCYTQIAVIDPERGMVTVIDDSASRGSSDQSKNELLSLLMVDGSTVTAYLRNCEYSSSLGSWKVLSEKPYQFTDSLQYNISVGASGSEALDDETGDQDDSEEDLNDETEQEKEHSRREETQRSEPAVIPPENSNSGSASQGNGSAGSSGSTQGAPSPAAPAPVQPNPTESIKPLEPGYEPTTQAAQPTEAPGPGNVENIPTIEANPESGISRGPGDSPDSVRFAGPGGN